MTTETQINKTMRTLYIIWLALMFSLVGYLVIGYAFPENANPTPMAPEMFQTLKMVVYGLAFFAAIAAGFLRRLVLSGKIIKVKTNNPSVDPVLSRYATGVILALALLETGGVYGFVLYIAGRDIRDLLLLTAFSAAAQLYYKPSRNELMALIQKHNAESPENQPQI